MQENPAEEKPEEEEKPEPEPAQEELVKPKKSVNKCGLVTAVSCLGCCALIIFGMLRNSTIEVDEDYGVYDDKLYDDKLFDDVNN